MKKIEAIIRSTKLEDVKTALHGVGVDYFTYVHVKDISLQKPRTEMYRGTEVEVDSLTRIALEILVSDKNLETVSNAIISAAKTGEVGDGKIIITPVEKAIRMRNGEDIIEEDVN
jgi:nitrogen regulatory protein P-II 1